jgi:tetratricopeptide (TPR) repeat protein
MARKLFWWTVLAAGLLVVAAIVTQRDGLVRGVIVAVSVAAVVFTITAIVRVAGEVVAGDDGDENPPVSTETIADARHEDDDDDPPALGKDSVERTKPGESVGPGYSVETPPAAGLSAQGEPAGPNARALTCLGDSRRLAGDWVGAAEAYGRAAAMLERDLGDVDPEARSVRADQAAAYLQAERYAEAEPVLRRLVDRWDRVPGATARELLWACDWHARSLVALKREPEAMEAFRLAVKVAEPLDGDGREQAYRLNELAWLLATCGRHAEAEPLARRSAEACRRLGAGSELLASVLDTLALACQGFGRTAEAEALWREAVALDEAATGPNAPTAALRAETLERLAALLRAAGRDGEAEPFEEKARGLRSGAANGPSPAA